MKKATYIKTLDGFNGVAKLYKLDPPLMLTDWDDNPKGDAEYVVVSAANVPYSGPETYIFQADKDGEITDWSELDGSFSGDLDHQRALSGAGYAAVSA